jgi:hypothetical protein
MFVRATMLDGTQHVSEFDKLTGIRQLSADVMSGRKPFPVWRVVGQQHPYSGEPTTIRTRMYVHGSQVLTLEVVEPGFDDHEYLPANFHQVARMGNGTAGTHRFTPETAPDADVDVSTEHEYPCHRDPDGRRYVILQWNSDAGDANVTHYIDAVSGDQSDITAAMGDWDDEEDL